MHLTCCSINNARPVARTASTSRSQVLPFTPRLIRGHGPPLRVYLGTFKVYRTISDARQSVRGTRRTAFLAPTFTTVPPTQLRPACRPPRQVTCQSTAAEIGCTFSPFAAGPCAYRVPHSMSNHRLPHGMRVFRHDSIPWRVQR